TGWRLRPAGHQVTVGTLPMSSALSPDGKFLLALNGGYNPPSISVLDVAAEKEVGRTPVEDGWLGLTFSPKGDFVYVGGGSRAEVVRFNYANGALTQRRSFPVVPEAKRTVKDFIGDVAISPDGRLIYAADLFHDSVVVINPQSGMLIERFKTGRRPYRILFHPDGKSFFVTSWTDGSLGHYDTANGNLLTTVRIGAHATDMVWRAGKNEEGEPAWVARLFVAAANTNNVYAVGVLESHGCAGAARRPHRGAQRPRPALVPEPERPQPDGTGSASACRWAGSCTWLCRAHSGRLGFFPQRAERKGARQLLASGAAQL